MFTNIDTRGLRRSLPIKSFMEQVSEWPNNVIRTGDPFPEVQKVSRKRDKCMKIGQFHNDLGNVSSFEVGT